MNDIIVGVDQTATAQRAAHAAAALASNCAANLHIMTCIRSDASYEAGANRDPRNIDSISEAETFLRRLKEQLPHDQVTFTVGLGDPATTMCDEATRLQARMIVVGNRRVQGAGRVLGSIAADVAKSARCDVLIANTTNGH